MNEIIKYPRYRLENHNVNRNDTCFFKSVQIMLSSSLDRIESWGKKEGKKTF